jgi:hypothetical protein
MGAAYSFVIGVIFLFGISDRLPQLRLTSRSPSLDCTRNPQNSALMRTAKWDLTLGT